VSTQQPPPPLNLPAESLITNQNVEHPRSITRRIKACLTLAGGATVGVLALVEVDSARADKGERLADPKASRNRSAT
jgi:hypothetical protein